MPAQEEKLDGQQILLEYATIFWCRKLWFFLPFFTAIVIAIGLVFWIPKSYRSTTLILVEEQKIPEAIVRSTVSEPIAGRLSTLRQQILSRYFLQEIITRFGLFKDFEGPVEEKIEAMRKAIDIKTMGGDRMNAFSISFIGSSPMVTMNVTNELASLLIKENFKIREQMVEGTREFIDGELESLKRTLEQQEAVISRFKQSFSGELPGQMDASLRTLDRLQITLQQTKMAIKDAEGVDPLAQAWSEQKQKMALLQRKYKENHPDVLAMKKEMRELEERILARNSASPSTNRIDLGNESLLSPTLQRGLSNSSELEELKSRAVRIEAQIRDFERRIENVPKREQDLAVLLRDYDNTQKNYQDLLDKKLTAKISENLEKRQKGEHFRILDSANFPEKPYKPDPIKLLIFGSLLGILSGIGLVMLREMTDASIRKPEDLEKLFPFPVLASILNYENFSEKLHKNRT
jgi:polysaccharide chain length determinant protein (PEP-CTERM system associated)